MGEKDKLIPVLQPSIGWEEQAVVREVLESRWLGLGPQTALFEEEFAKYVGVPYAVGTNSGTAALLLALKCAGVGEGDEVITPSLNFVSAANCIIQLGGKVVFADVEPDTLTIDPKDIAAKVTERTKAIVLMHYAGHPCDISSLQVEGLGVPQRITVIEDAAHALGATYKDTMVGAIGQYSCFSFHAVKPITSGEGGMVCCHRQEDMERMKRLRWLGISRSTHERISAGSVVKPMAQDDVTEIGWKCHMHDISAVIGRQQLKKIDRLWEKRDNIAHRYWFELADLDWLELPVSRPGVKHAWHLFVVRLDQRNELQQYLKAKGITTGIHYLPNHLTTAYSEHRNDDLPVTNREWQRILSLPIPHDLSEQDQERVISTIKDWRPQ